MLDKFSKILIIFFLFSSPMIAQNLTIMTYNLRLDTPQDSANNWQYRKVELAQLIQKHQPDLLGTQEGLHHQVVELAKLLPDYQWFGIGRDDGRQAGELMAIFYRTSQLELLDSGHFWLSEQPEVPGSRSWQSACARMLTWGKFKHRQYKQVFFHFNSHFDHYSPEARLMGAKLVTQKLSEITEGELTLLTADMNFTPQDSVYQMMTTNWSDSRLLAKHSKHQNSSFNAFRGIQTNMLIDYIWISDKNKVKIKSYTIDESRKPDGRFPSDHFPVIVKLNIL